ncbi:enoyl-CoA hydratase-related protein [Fusibacter sp. JL298sf-3]
MLMSHILFEKMDGVGVVTFNRTSALNALNTEVLGALERLVEEVKKDDSLRVLVFTGAGKAFVAGADIKEMSTMSAEEARQFAGRGQRVFSEIEKMDKVTIAAVNGFALGGGCEMALACDIRLAGTKAKFGQPEVKLGITPGFAGSQRLPKLIGVSHAKYMILTGDMIGADKALELGLVSGVYEDVLEEAISLGSRIARNAPLALSYSKKAIDEGLTVPLEQGNRIEAAYFGLSFATEDQKRGMKAFIEKEEVEFKGR